MGSESWGGGGSLQPESGCSRGLVEREGVLSEDWQGFCHTKLLPPGTSSPAFCLWALKHCSPHAGHGHVYFLQDF